MPLKRIIISVTNDLVTDQRVRRIGGCLEKLGYEVLFVGRRQKRSGQLPPGMRAHRFRMLFQKGFLFYAEYNLRLFFFLLFRDAEVHLANDLDTLLPNFLVSKMRSRTLVYDSHELFTEVPELQSRPRVRSFWLFIEKLIFPQLKNVYTVNERIAKIYEDKYGVRVSVIRNMAPKVRNRDKNQGLRSETGGKDFLLILQGAGINRDRGAEEAIRMMQYLENCRLLIIGGGDVFDGLQELVTRSGLNDRVMLLPKMPYDELLEYTKISDLGLSLDKGGSGNYEYALPNKLFDYVQCGVPVLVSGREVPARFIRENRLGWVNDSTDPEDLAQTVRGIFDDEKAYTSVRQNVLRAAEVLNWEEESKKCKDFYLKLEK